MSVVSVAQGMDVKGIVYEAVDLVGSIKSVVHSDDKVVIKPNLTTALPYDTGLTTDPRVVGALVDLCRSAGSSEIVIAEGSGGVDTHVAFEKCGYLRLAEKYNLKLVDLNESPVTTVDVPEGRALRVIDVPNVILESDVLINVPKLKLRMGWATLSVKNLLGAVPGRGEVEGGMWTPEARWFKPKGEKRRVHAHFEEAIVDLNIVVHPSMTVMDGVVACYEHKPVEMNVVLASKDPLALDCIAIRIGGLNLSDVAYLKCAAERGLGEANPKRIQVVGAPLDEIIGRWRKGALKET